MSLYDAMKDVVNIAQKADNVELYRQLLDLSAQALDMQNEIAHLQAENQELKRKSDISDKIIRHKDPFLTLQGHPTTEMYCANCWGANEKLIQVQRLYHGSFSCPICGTHGVYDEALANKTSIQADSSGGSIKFI